MLVALYWHPFLVQMLRLRYSDRLIIRDKLPLGDLPLEADLLLVRRDPAVVLPYPLQFLGRQTLVEYKSPDDTADQAALEQLEIYGMLHCRREGLPRRGELTLWLMASQIAANVSQPGRTELVGLHAVGPGVSQGMLDGFPTYLIDLQGVPFTPDTIPLHMVATGRQERALVEYIIEHYQHHPAELDLMQHLHMVAFMEVLMLHGLTLEQIGIDEDALVKLIGLSKHPAKYLKYLDRKQLAKGLDTEELAKGLIEQLGPEKARELIERLAKSPSSEESPPSDK
jgi:hypothetical protein